MLGPHEIRIHLENGSAGTKVLRTREGVVGTDPEDVLLGNGGKRTASLILGENRGFIIVRERVEIAKVDFRDDDDRRSHILTVLRPEFYSLPNRVEGKDDIVGIFEAVGLFPLRYQLAARHLEIGKN